MSKQAQAQNAKSTPPAPVAPQISVSSPLNDDNWNTHIHIIFPDDKIALGNSLQPLYDAIASGYRQKFTVLQKSDLMTWYLENIRLDVCKDIKAVLDANGGNETAIPDFQMAKLIKTRLLYLKQEGIEARNAAKSLSEAAAVPAQLVPDAAKPTAKAGAKDDKGKDRAKSPAKKPPAKGDKKAAPEPASRPESAQAAEISKRKTKLRDKGGKDSAKIQPIGDEPPDGPDAYYLLKDFTNIGAINSLMEELDVQIHTIFRATLSTLAPTPKTSTPTTQDTISLAASASNASVQLLQQTAEIKAFSSGTSSNIVAENRLFSEAREWCQSASEDSLWRHIAWCDAKIPALYEGKDVFDVFARKIYTQLKLRREFKDYYNRENIVDIPSISEISSVKNELVSLQNLFDAMPYSMFSNPEIILGIIVDYVIRFIRADEETDGTAGVDTQTSSPMYDEMGSFLNYFESSFKKLSIKWPSRVNETSSEMLKCHRYGDNLWNSKFLLKDLNAFGVNVPDMVSALLELFPMAKLQQSLGNPSSLKDPRVLLARAANFNAFKKQHSSVGDALRVVAQNEFEEILNTSTEQNWNLDDWLWVEKLDKNTMAQILQQTHAIRPNIRHKFSDRLGKLLIACWGPGSVGLPRFDSTESLHIRTKVQFGLFYELNEHHKHLLALSPRPKNGEAKQPIYFVGDSVIERSENRTVLYPFDNARLAVDRWTHLNSNPEIHLSLQIQNHHLLWRCGQIDPFLVASFDGSTVLSVTGSQKGPATVIVSSAEDGSIVEFRSDGSAVLRFDANNVTRSAAVLQSESSRIIRPDGTVARYFSNGTIETYFPAGATAVYSPTNGTWTTTDNTGTRMQCTSSNMQSTGVEIAPIRVAKETLIALGELIVTREDMVVTHTRQDGSTLAEFADGTSISSSHADEVAVEKAGCPRFEFRDRGKRLMVRLRSGTVIETEISDGGSACAGAARKFSVQNQDLRTFNFETSIDGASKLVVNTCASGSNECVFDWVGGSFSATDSSNGTRFAVDSSGGCTVTPSQVTPQLVNSEEAVAPLDPVNSEGGFVRQFLQSPLRATPDVPCNPPALFMLEDDGSGVQLLRDLDLFEFFKGCSQNPDVEIIERIINENDTPAGLAVTVVGKPYSSAQASSDIVVFRQLIRYPPVGLTERTAIKERLAKPATPAATEELNRTSSSNLEDLRPKVVLGRDKLETVAEIVRMYSLHRKQHCGIDAIGDSQVHKEEKAHRMQELMDRKEQLRHKQTLPSAAQ